MASNLNKSEEEDEEGNGDNKEETKRRKVLLISLIKHLRAGLFHMKNLKPVRKL